MINNIHNITVIVIIIVLIIIIILLLLLPLFTKYCYLKTTPTQNMRKAKSSLIWQQLALCWLNSKSFTVIG